MQNDMNNKIAIIKSLSVEQRDFLVKTLRQKSLARKAETLPKFPKQGPAPLSFAQERMWFLNELVPGNPAYHIFIAVCVKGPLNANIFEQSLREIIKRHESLRTGFLTFDGQPFLNVLTDYRIPLHRVDLTHIPENMRKKTVNQFASEEAKKPFDLSCAPLIRINLLKMEEYQYMLFITMHHIISDGWSIGIFLKELASFYEGFSEGVSPQLPELSYRYVDYAYWQREWLCGETLKSKLAYWQQLLENGPYIFELPLDYPRPSSQSYRGAVKKISFPGELCQKVKELCIRENTTLFTVLLATFNLLLYKYVYQDSIIVGVPVANRTRNEFEGLIGCFVNTIALRTSLSGNPTFKELLNRINQVNMEAFEYQEVPFDLLVEELNPARDLSRHPIFQVMFVFQNAPMKTIESKNLSFEIMKVDSETSKFDLTLELYEDEGVKGWFEYNTDLFEDATLTRMAKHFENLLANIVKNPELNISKIDVLDQGEKYTILKEWNHTRHIYPTGINICQMIEKHADQFRDEIAVVFENKILTYGELNKNANQLASYLKKMGIGPEILVGVCMERSLEMVIALLGILKAGGAYVPVDPDYPKGRLELIVKDARMPIVLIQSRFKLLTEEWKTKIISVDSEWDTISKENPANLESKVVPDNLMYVIYTSGSTGKPKGVMNTYGALYNRLMWHQKAFCLQKHDRVLQKTPFSFDVSVWEFFWTLMFGGRLVVAAPGGHKDGSYIMNTIIEAQISIIHFVPSMLNVFLEEEGIENCSCLRKVICSGEALTYEIQKRFFEVLPKVELHNLYGPTEAAVDVAHWQCRPTDETRNVPIGRPIDNVELYILDPDLNPVPLKVPGELYIGGAGLARGYLNRPDLTKERFMINPYSDTPGARLYRTGDLVRFRPDGNIEYLGRNDFQVKIRGLRIELGEVETVIVQHPVIHDAIVIMREDIPGVKRLVAYIVGKPGHELNKTELKRYLSERLPEYMVPSLIMQVDQIPLLNNGKINRGSLPVPDYFMEKEENSYVAPRTPAEKKLAEIWSKLLKIEPIGINDKFFELGGDSILSIQVVSRANQAGLRLTPKQIFEHQTIEELAKVADPGVTIDSEQGMVTGAVWLTPIQYWFFEQELVEPYHYNQAVLLQLTRPICPGVLKNAVEKIMVKHDVLRMRFLKKEDGWEQFNHGYHGEVPFEWLERNNLTAREQDEIIRNKGAELQSGLNLTEGPLLRIFLFNFDGGASGYLLIVLHHLVVDGISWRIIIHDLEVLCGNSGELPAKTTSFKRYAELLHDYAENRFSANDMLPYLESIDQSQLSTIPVDYSEVKTLNNIESLDSILSILDESQTKDLLINVPKVFHTTMNDILLTALIETLKKMNDENTLIVDVESHGREEFSGEIDLSNTVGWFTTIYPVVLDITGAKNYGDSIKMVKEQVRLSLKNSFNYGILKYLRRDTDEYKKLTVLPKAEVLFNYLGQFDELFSDQSLFQISEKPIGPTQNGKQQRSYLLEINCHIFGGKLHFNWNYSQNVHRKSTVEDMATVFLHTLGEIIDYCKTNQGGFTPADFPLAVLDQVKIDEITAGNSNIEDIYPLTPMQALVLSYNLFSRKSGTNIQQISWNMKGDFVINAFKKAWLKVVEHHPILRTSFIWRKVAEPLQIVHYQVKPDFLELNWSLKSPDEQKQAFRELTLNWGKQSFKVEEAPLTRFCMIQLNPTTYKFIWIYWTSLFDNWSWANIMSEVFLYYRAYVENSVIPTPKIIPFKDYIRWIAKQNPDDAKQFWTEELKGFHASLDFKIQGFSIESIRNKFEPGEAKVRFSDLDTIRLNNFAPKNGITPGTVFQGAWVLLLSHLSGEADVLYGVLTYGRPASLKGVETMVGLLANDLPVRVKVEGCSLVTQWLKSIQNKQVRMRQYDYISIPEISSWSQVPQSIIQRVIYERTFIFTKAPEEEFLSQELSNGTIEFSEFNNSLQFNIPLRIYVEPGEVITIKIKYNKSTFSPDLITYMLGKMREYIQTLINYPDSLLKDLL
jgi:amino acid adenylation domain-containing protein/non-ribosomal peptide synthase protein (TIGR01720 family)